MVKRIIIGGFFAIIFVALLILYFFSKAEGPSQVSVSVAVPESAIVFVDKIDYSFFINDFRNVNSIWLDLLSFQGMKKQDSLWGMFNSGLHSMPVLKEELVSQKLSLSIHLLGKDELSVLYFLKLGDDVNENELDAEIRNSFGGNAIVNERKYEAVEIKDLSFGNTNVVKKVSYTITKGLLILSSKSMLVEDAVRTLHSGGGVFESAAFKKVSKTAGRFVDANVYINFPQIQQLFYPFIRDNRQDALAALSGLANWGEFDPEIGDDVFVLNGMISSGDSLQSWLNLFMDQDPVKNDIFSVIPANMVKCGIAGISDPSAFENRFKKEMKIRGHHLKLAHEEEDYVDLFGYSPFSDLFSLLMNEIAWCTVEIPRTGEQHDISIVEVRSRSEAQDHLTQWISVLAADTDTEYSDYVGDYRLDNQAVYKVYTLPITLYPDISPLNIIKKHFAFFENYIIFSDSKEAISKCIYQNLLHKTLENDQVYMELGNLLSTKSNFIYLVQPFGFISGLGTIVNDKSVELQKELDFFLKKIPAVMLQVSKEEDLFYSSVGLKYTSKIKEKALTVWESLLDSAVIIKPVLVTNHRTSEKEILVQDASNALYLINGAGRVLWKLRLDGPIKSEIFQVDYYRNNKLQYLFNTASGIHLIDRNGNYVERYPVTLRADASNGMALFDYDKSRDYRIFIACNDKKVYLYDIKGNIVPGWAFKKTEGQVINPVQHFRIKDKDYIVFSDEIRTYILNRKGKERVKAKEMIAVSENNGFFLDMNISGNNPRLISTDTSGNVFGIDFSGNVDYLMEHINSTDHFFMAKDLDHDGVLEYIFSSDGKLDVVKESGETFFTFKVKGEFSSQPHIYEFSSNDMKIGVTDNEKNRIYLLNSDGTVYEGFPLEGNTRFSIGYFTGSDSRFNLIVGNENGFLYNYSIQ